MDILDSAASTAAHRAPGGPASATLQRVTGGRPSSVTTAALLLAAGFALVLAAQVLPWARVALKVQSSDVDGFSLSTSSSSTGVTVSASSMETVLSIPYHLLWVAVFGLAGAVMFAPLARRRMLFGAAFGAVIAQAAVVIPLLKAPYDINSAALIEDSSISTTTTYSAGTYCLVAALVVIVVALILAVGGKVLPGAEATSAAAYPFAAVPGFAGAPLGAAPTDYAASGYPIPAGYPAPVALGHPAAPATFVAPLPSVATPTDRVLGDRSAPPISPATPGTPVVVASENGRAMPAAPQPTAPGADHDIYRRPAQDHPAI